MLKKISLYTGVSALNALIGLLVVLYLTHVLRPEQYAYLGIYGTFIFFLNPALSFSSLSLVSINTVDLGDRYPQFANNFINFVMVTSLVIFLLGVIVISSLGLSVDYVKLSFFAIITSFLSVFVNMHYLELIYSSRVKAFAIYKILFALIGAGGTVYFISVFGANWENRLLGLLIGASSTLLLMILYSFNSLKKLKLNLNFDTKSFLAFGAPLMIGLGAAWLNTQSDKYIVLKYFNKETLGFYSFGSSLGMAFIMVNQSIVNAIAPKIFEGLKNKNIRKELSKYFMFSCGFITLVILLAELTLEFAGQYLFGEQYIESIPIVQLILISILFNGAYRVYGLVLEYYKENTIMTVIAYIVAVINLILSILLIPYVGFYGPVVGTIFAWIINFILYYYYSQKVLDKKQVV
jgi:O-antigen/teichoic acid export membrane protein